MPSVSVAAVVTHVVRDGVGRRVGAGCARSRAAAASSSVGRRRQRPTSRSCSAATGRCSARSRGSSAPAIPVLGVNYGRVGFLTAIAADDLEDGHRARVRGRVPRRSSCATLEVKVGGDDGRSPSTTSSSPAARSAGWSSSATRSAARSSACQPCDGLICATPAGSTAYNLSNGGPVLVWGLEAMVLTFVAPHALARPPARRPARRRRADHERDARWRRPCSSTASRSGELATGEQAVVPGRRAAQPARDAARGHVLPPVRRHVRPMTPTGALPTMGACSARSASRTSS